MLPGGITETILFKPNYIIVNNDSMDIIRGETISILPSQLLYNDINILANTELIINNLTDNIGCVVTYDSDNKNIIVKCNDNTNVGDTCSFKYSVTNGSDIQEGTVSFDVIEPTTMVLNDDIIKLNQDEYKTIMHNDLLFNDVFESSIPIIDFSVNTHTNLDMTKYSSYFNVKSNLLAFRPIQTTYSVEDRLGRTSTANINIHTLPLPTNTGYIFETDADLNSFINIYTPPTQLEIFENWYRFSHNTFFATAADAVGTEAASWYYDTATETIVCSVNSANPIGFIDNTSRAYGDYELECRVASTNTDDDGIGIVIGFKRIGNVNYRLILWCAERGIYSSASTVVTHTLSSTGGLVVLSGYTTTINRFNSSGTKVSGWAGAGYRWMKVRKENGIVRCQVSTWSNPYYTSTGVLVSPPDMENEATRYDGGVDWTINLATNPELEIYLNDSSYGFCSFSQNAATFQQINYTALTSKYNNYAFSLSGVTYEYNSNTFQWEVSTKVLTETFDKVMFVKNEYNDNIFIFDNSIYTIKNKLNCNIGSIITIDKTYIIDEYPYLFFDSVLYSDGCDIEDNGTTLSITRLDENSSCIIRYNTTIPDLVYDFTITLIT